MGAVKRLLEELSEPYNTEFRCIRCGSNAELFADGIGTGICNECGWQCPEFYSVETEFDENVVEAIKMNKTADELNDAIRELSLRVQAEREQLLENKRAVDLKQLSILQELNDELDENGKKKYSNEVARKSQMEKILSTDAEYIQLLEGIKNLNKRIAVDSIELDYLRGKLTILLHPAKIGGEI